MLCQLGDSVHRSMSGKNIKFLGVDSQSSSLHSLTSKLYEFKQVHSVPSPMLTGLRRLSQGQQVQAGELLFLIGSVSLREVPGLPEPSLLQLDEQKNYTRNVRLEQN